MFFQFFHWKVGFLTIRIVSHTNLCIAECTRSTCWMNTSEVQIDSLLMCGGEPRYGHHTHLGVTRQDKNMHGFVFINTLFMLVITETDSVIRYAEISPMRASREESRIRWSWGNRGVEIESSKETQHMKVQIIGWGQFTKHFFIQDVQPQSHEVEIQFL